MNKKLGNNVVNIKSIIGYKLKETSGNNSSNSIENNKSNDNYKQHSD